MIAPRRLVTVPLATALSVCVLVLSPLLLAGSTLVAVATRSSRPARTVSLATVYAFIELRTLVKLAVGDLDGDRLMTDLLNAAYAAARKLLDVEVVLDPTCASPESIPRDEPVIVLSRHCGPGDPVLVAWLLMFRYRLQVRIVLKAVLHYEPVLDLAGQRGCLCFLARGDRARQQIHDLAASLGGGQALLLFPEGGELHTAAVAQRHRRTTQDGPDPRSRTRATTLLYAAAARRRRHRCGERSAQRQCPGTHPQRLLPRRASTTVVAAAGPPAIACPHDPHPGCATS